MYSEYQPQHDMATHQMPREQTQFADSFANPINQHQSIPVDYAPPRDWSSGLFDCFSDMEICCMTCCCTCIQYSENYEKFRGVPRPTPSGTYFMGARVRRLVCFEHQELRADIRNRYNISEKHDDCLVSFCCGPCAVCQEARQLKSAV